LGGVSLNHWFDGGGMLQAFHFQNGAMSHRGALLATPELKAEEAAGRLLVYEISPTGQLRRQHVMAVPQADMVHDFAITEGHLVFLLMPLKFSGQIGTGNMLSHYRWEDQSPLVVLLVDKADFKVQRFELPATGVFHLANVEFSRFHPARNGLPTQFTTLLARSRQMDARVDGCDNVLTLHGEQQRLHHYGDGWIAEEHVYVPASTAAAEGQGWVLNPAFHWPTERTTLSVFDALAVDAAPLARVTLPYGLPLGLHGQFVAA
jgi:carotenoid cleavage dioxygenase-like enzyme